MDKKRMQIVLVGIACLALVGGVGYAAYVILWQPAVPPTVTVATKGFEAKLVDPTLEACWDPDGTFDNLVETIVLTPSGTDTYDVMLVVGTMRAVTGGNLTIGMENGAGEWWFQITACELLRRDFATSAFVQVTDYLEGADPDPIDSSYLFDTTALYLDPGNNDRHVIHIEYEVKQTGMVVSDSQILTSEISISADMFEPPA